MRRFMAIVVSILSLFIAVAFAQTSASLQQARKYFDEHSYQLAVEEYQRILAGEPALETKLEATFWKGRSHAALSNWDEARRSFDELTTAGQTDVWAGRAHWWLEPGLHQNAYYAHPTSAPLEHLRLADEILTREKPADLVDFYKDVVFNAVGRVSLEKEKIEDRRYLFGFFDKVMPLLKDDEDRAQVLIKKALSVGYVDLKPQPDETIAQLRTVIAEFKETKAAPQAQMAVVQALIGRNQIVDARTELKTLISTFGQSPEAKTAREMVKEIEAEQVTFQLSGSYLPGDKIEFELRTRNLGNVEIKVIPFNPVELLKSHRKPRFDLSKIAGTVAHRQEPGIQKRDDYLPSTTTVHLDFHEPGAYVIRAEGGGAHCVGMLLISDLMLVSNSASGRFEFWSVEAKSGKPRPGSTVTVGSNPEQQKSWLNKPGEQLFTKIETARADESGFMDVKLGQEHTQCLVVAQDGNHFAVIDNIYWNPWYNNSQRSARCYVYTDRPVYRPNQKVYWRAVMREQDGGEIKHLPNIEFDVTITDPKGNNIVNHTKVTSNEFGSLAGELDLPEGAALGQYHVSIQGQHSNQHISTSGNFRVEEYKKPEYDVKVKAGEKLARIGEDVEAQVDANYYFGGPVGDAQVKYTVRRRPHWVPWWFHRDFNYGQKDELGWFNAREERGEMHNSGGDIVATGEGKTDAGGKYKINFKAEVPDKEQVNSRGWYTSNQRTFDFQIEVTVIDKSRRNIDASDTVVVSDRALQISASPQCHLYIPGDVAKVNLRSLNFSDEPVATSGTLYVEKVRWIPETAKEEVTTLTTRRVDIGSSGSLITSWRIPQGESGHMRFLLVVDDPFGMQSAAYGDFTVADENTKDIFYKYQGIEVIVDKDIYDVGETAKVVILSTNPDAYAWYWIDAGTGNLEKKVIPLPHRTNFLMIPITEQFVPNSMIHVVSVRDKAVHQDQKEIVVPPKRKVITVEVSPEKDTFKPGEEGSVHLVARDYAGNPVRGEFSISLFDKSILYIAPEMRPDIRRVYYGERRPVHASIENSAVVPMRYTLSFPHYSSYMYRYPGMKIRTATGWDTDRDQWYLFDGGDRAKQRYFRMYGETAASDGAVSRLAMAPAAMPALAGTAQRGESQKKLKAERKDTPSIQDKEFENNYFVSEDAFKFDDSVSGAGSPMKAPVLRTDFRDSMFWSPTVVTDASGRATVKVKFPDSLTTWRATAVGVDQGFLVGEDSTETLVKKNLLVRLQAPRFFRERDRVTLSAIAHNNLESTKSVELRLKANGLEAPDAKPVTVEVAPHGETRADWEVSVKQWGDAVVRVDALTDEESDAMEMKFPVLPHGIDKFVAWTGSSADQTTSLSQVQKNGDETVITQSIEIPKERIRESTKLQVIVNPSLASCIREALPYLIEYPYGCVEQTMSRFMPAAIVGAAFRDMSIPQDALLTEKLPKVLEQGLARLAAFQHSDGGWGWWKDDTTNDHMTAYVMYGLTAAKDAGVQVDPSMFSRGLDRLDQQLREFDKFRDEHSHYWYHYDLHTRMLQMFVLSLNGRSNPQALDFLWTHRDKLRPQGLAFLARTLWRSNRQDDARIVLRNMYNVAVITPENGTARWGLVERCWYWWDDAVESTAQGLIAHLEIDPQNALTTEAMKWLVLNRTQNHWKSTKDSGQAVLALAAYMKDRKETATEMDLEVQIGDLPAKTYHLDGDNFWSFKSDITLSAEEVPDGKFPVRITQKGKGTIFYNIYADYFTQEEGIRKAGHEIFVERTYEKQVREKVTDTTATAAKDTYVPVKDGEVLKSGDELRVTLKIKSLNDYEYLVFEDPKPAGMEPVKLQSGSTYGNGFCSNMELRDKHIAFFVTHMPQGEHTITYNCRAEIPGEFHTMPTTGYAMYFPPLRTNADEIVLKVED